MQFQIANLNVGGQLFKVSWKSIMRKSYSIRLCQLYTAITPQQILKYCDDYNPDEEEYFFDRHPKFFSTILHLLKFGVIYNSYNICIMSLEDDFEYWGIDKSLLANCCYYFYNTKYDISKEEYNKVQTIYLNKFNYQPEDINGRFAKMRSRIWDLMENPEKNKSAQVMTIISIMFIVVSTVTLVVSSLPTDTGGNSTSPRSSIDNEGGGITGIIESICIVWFTFEYLIRLIACPQKAKFLMGFLNCIDVISISPFYICALMNFVMNNEAMAMKLDSVRQVMQIFRVLRVLRILKFARHSVGLQSLGYTLKRSYNELGMLLMFIGMGALLFSSLTYFAEKDEKGTIFTSILSTAWWSIISMTTVGYGDMHPVTTIGQVIGSICCVSGVLIISLPIPIIVNNFGEFYKDKMRIENTINKRNELFKAKESGSVVFVNNNFSRMKLFNRSTSEEEIEMKLLDFHLKIKNVKYADDE